MKHRLFPLVALISFAALLLRYPRESAAAARDGLMTCYTLIIPSLFPFFVFSSLFIALNLTAICAPLFAHLMRPLFSLAGICSTPLILGLTGGYPVGIRAAAQMYEAHHCTKNEALRLTSFCNNCGPGFLLSVAGIVGFFEISTGISSLAPLYADPLALPLAAFILGWGSLSVHCQSLPFLNRCPGAKVPYFTEKLLQGAIAAGLSAFLLPLLPEPLGTWQQVALWQAPSAALLRREIFALFCLAGIFWLLKKKTGKPRPPGV